MKWPVSLVIITLNEEKNIARCIASVPHASEVIVVDSFSKDQTVSIAEGLGAKVSRRQFSGYRDQKQYACSLAKEPWILSLDADEVLSPELLKELDEFFKKPGDYAALRFPRLSYHLHKWIRHGGWYPDHQIRLFRKDSYSWSGGEVHEAVQVVGPVATTKAPLEHFVFSDLTHQITTNNDYSSRGALQLFKSRKRFFIAKLVVKPFWKFVECYFWKGGWKDGVAGFIIALGAAQSMFLKYAKLWELYEFQDQG